MSQRIDYRFAALRRLERLQRGRQGTRLNGQAKQACGVLPVDLPQDVLGQPNSIDSPTPLRGNRCRRVIKILILGFQKPEVDFVQSVAENLLRCVRTVRYGIGSEKNPILIAIKELSRCSRLAAEFADSGPQFNAGICKPIEAFANIREIFSIIPYVQ